MHQHYDEDVFLQSDLLSLRERSFEQQRAIHSSPLKPGKYKCIFPDPLHGEQDKLPSALAYHHSNPCAKWQTSRVANLLRPSSAPCKPSNRFSPSSKKRPNSLKDRTSWPGVKRLPSPQKALFASPKGSKAMKPTKSSTSYSCLHPTANERRGTLNLACFGCTTNRQMSDIAGRKQEMTETTALLVHGRPTLQEISATENQWQLPEPVPSLGSPFRLEPGKRNNSNTCLPQLQENTHETRLEDADTHIDVTKAGEALQRRLSAARAHANQPVRSTQSISNSPQTQAKSILKSPSISHLTRPMCIPPLNGFSNSPMEASTEHDKPKLVEVKNRHLAHRAVVRNLQALSPLPEIGPTEDGDTRMKNNEAPDISYQEAFDQQLRDQTAFIVRPRGCPTSPKDPRNRPLPELPQWLDRKTVDDIHHDATNNGHDSSSPLQASSRSSSQCNTSSLHEPICGRELLDGMTNIDLFLTARPVRPRMDSDENDGQSRLVCQHKTESHEDGKLVSCCGRSRASTSTDLGSRRIKRGGSRSERVRALRKRDIAAASKHPSVEDLDILAQSSSKVEDPIFPTMADQLAQFPAVPLSPPSRGSGKGYVGLAKLRTHSHHNMRPTLPFPRPGATPSNPGGQQKLTQSGIMVLVDTDPITSEFQAGVISHISSTGSRTGASDQNGSSGRARSSGVVVAPTRKNHNSSTNESKLSLPARMSSKPVRAGSLKQSKHRRRRSTTDRGCKSPSEEQFNAQSRYLVLVAHADSTAKNHFVSDRSSIRRQRASTDISGTIQNQVAWQNKKILEQERVIQEQQDQIEVIIRVYDAMLSGKTEGEILKTASISSSARQSLKAIENDATKRRLFRKLPDGTLIIEPKHVSQYSASSSVTDPASSIGWPVDRRVIGTKDSFDYDNLPGLLRIFTHDQTQSGRIHLQSAKGGPGLSVFTDLINPTSQPALLTRDHDKQPVSNHNLTTLLPAPPSYPPPPIPGSTTSAASTQPIPVAASREKVGILDALLSQNNRKLWPGIFYFGTSTANNANRSQSQPQLVNPNSHSSLGYMMDLDRPLLVPPEDQRRGMDLDLMKRLSVGHVLNDTENMDKAIEMMQAYG